MRKELNTLLSPRYILGVSNTISHKFIETINADDLINADQDNVNYHINAELNQCIKAARDIPNKPYNFEVELISA